MKITIFGTGYVALVTGACLAEVGHNVLCMDIDESKVEALRNGVIPIFEPGLESLVLNNTRTGNLLFCNDVYEAVNYSDLLFIAVGTPPDEDGSADLSHVINCCRQHRQIHGETKGCSYQINRPCRHIRQGAPGDVIRIGIASD